MCSNKVWSILGALESLALYPNINGAKFNGANLKGANLKGVNLKGANLKGAKFTDFTSGSIFGANI